MKKSKINVQFGGSVFGRFKDLNYSLWYAIAEFVDNSSHSYFENEKEIKKVKGGGLEVRITFKNNEVLMVTDNAYGMNKRDLEDLVEVARPKKAATVQRSEFGMGLKTGGFWLGKRIEIVTKKLNEKATCTLVLDLNKLVSDDFECDVVESVTHKENESFTIIKITDFHRVVSRYAENKTKQTLASMYALDIKEKKMKLWWNTNPVEAHKREVAVIDGVEKKWNVNLDINGKKVVGFLGALAPKYRGRKNAGIGISRNGRNINNCFNWWKPEVIFGEQGRNDLVNQRVFGELEFDKRFGVSQTKDKIQFEGDEEIVLMKELKSLGAELINWAKGFKARGGNKGDEKGGISDETEKEIQQALGGTDIDTIINDRNIVNDGEVAEEVQAVLSEVVSTTPAFKFKIGASAVATIWLKADALDDKYVIIHNRDLLDLKIVINVLHPAYERMEALGDELVLKEYVIQCVYDALAECILYTSSGDTKISPDIFRAIKDEFLRLNRTEIGN
tara:strand:+ start:3522 stop:5033 length:1512 start_codon:yes stop_codon:yes gene_type:complete